MFYLPKIKVGFSAKTEKDLLRSEYGLLWNGLTKLGEAVVSDEVAVNLEIEGNVQKPVAVEVVVPAPAVSAETKAADAVVGDKKEEAKPKAKKAKKAKKAEKVE